MVAVSAGPQAAANPCDERVNLEAFCTLPSAITPSIFVDMNYMRPFALWMVLSLAACSIFETSDEPIPEAGIGTLRVASVDTVPSVSADEVVAVSAATRPSYTLREWQAEDSKKIRAALTAAIEFFAADMIAKCCPRSAFGIDETNGSGRQQ
jgi:hypothetical protein